MAVVGCGYWGPNLVRNFSHCATTQVAMVCDEDASRLEKVARNCPNAKLVDSFRAVLDERAIDAVAIATPVGNHAEMALAALEAGKHVLIEKPMADNVRDAEEMVRRAEKHGLTLMVDHTFIYSGPVRKMKEIHDSGELGQLYYVDSVRINLGLFQHDVNVVWDLAPHDLSIMDYLIGRVPKSLSAFGTCHADSENEIEDVAHLNLDFGDGLVASFHVNWLSPVKVRHFILGGSRKSLVYNDLEPSERIKVYDRGITINHDPEARRGVLIGYRTGDIWSPHIDAQELLRMLVETDAFPVLLRIPFLEGNDHLDPLLYPDGSYAEHIHHIDYPDPPNLHEMAEMLASPPHYDVAVSRDLDDIVGHQPVTSLDEIECYLALSYAAPADDEEPDAVDIGERSVEGRSRSEYVLEVARQLVYEGGGRHGRAEDRHAVLLSELQQLLVGFQGFRDYDAGERLREEPLQALPALPLRQAAHVEDLRLPYQNDPFVEVVLHESGQCECRTMNIGGRDEDLALQAFTQGLELELIFRIVVELLYRIVISHRILQKSPAVRRFTLRSISPSSADRPCVDSWRIPQRPLAAAASGDPPSRTARIQTGRSTAVRWVDISLWLRLRRNDRRRACRRDSVYLFRDR